jgi:type II secretion system protein H
MEKKIITNEYNGFTFIELMVVIVIMTIMASVAFVSLQSSKANTRLQAAQREVTATIKQAQSYALQGRMQPPAKVCGYGVRFISENEYEIFYKVPTSGNICAYGEYESFSAESLQLENGVVLSNFDSDDTEIYFSIPFGIASGFFAGHSMTFEYPAGSGVTKTIDINSNGSITEN